MRKNKSVMIVIPMLLALMLMLGACGGGGDALKGKWEGKSQDMAWTWTFDGKGACKTENEYGIKDEGTYTIDGSNVTIKLSMWDNENQYQFKVDGDHLSLTSDESYRPSYELDKK